MRILLASRDQTQSQQLQTLLAARTRHEVVLLGSEAEIASAPEAQVLLFGPEFDTEAGREARAALRGKVPGIQTVRLDDTEPENVIAFLRQMQGNLAARDEALPIQLGDYELRQRMRSTPTTDIYRAWQKSVNREVAVERLRPEYLDDTDAVRMFRRMVRARAQISHPHIAAVYDAEETGDSLHYARELIRGKHLEEMAASGQKLPQETTLQLIRAAAEAVVYFDEKSLPREPLTPHDIFLGPDGLPRVANLVTSQADPGLNDAADIRAVANAAHLLLPAGQGGRELAHVIGLMKSRAQHAANTWPLVARETRAALQRLSETRTSLLGEGGHTKSSRRGRTILLASILGALGLGGAALAWFVPKAIRSRPRDLSAMVAIPSGSFIYGDGEEATGQAFWIDKFEVSIGQYSGFLDSLPHGPANRFDHPDQPKAKESHTPKDWAQILPAARDGGTWKGYPVSLNSPVFNVDWWDAAAYAKWKGRRLPTAREWERAARGAKGLLAYETSGGSQGAINTGEDYSESTSSGGKKDGSAWWCDVDLCTQDRSPEGVIGMAGNVAEWTADWAPHPDEPDRKVPVFRGGDFHQSAVPLNKPWIARDVDFAQPFVGFRTVSDTAP